jgi:hypothetical protein
MAGKACDRFFTATNATARPASVAAAYRRCPQADRGATARGWRGRRFPPGPEARVPFQPRQLAVILSRQGRGEWALPEVAASAAEGWRNREALPRWSQRRADHPPVVTVARWWQVPAGRWPDASVDRTVLSAWRRCSQERLAPEPRRIVDRACCRLHLYPSRYAYAQAPLLRRSRVARQRERWPPAVEVRCAVRWHRLS